MQAIHNQSSGVNGGYPLFSKSKDTINASNSQHIICVMLNNFAVFKEQRYDKCKQFTTIEIVGQNGYRLFSKSKDTINASNSQRDDSLLQFSRGCFQRAKIR